LVKKERHTRGGIEKTYIKVIEAYRPGPGLPPKQRVIKTFGWLEDAPDPAALLAEAQEFDRQWRASARDTVRAELPGSVALSGGENTLYSYGCCYLGSVYDILGLEKFCTGDRFKYQVVAKLLPRRDCLYLAINPAPEDTLPRHRSDVREHLQRRLTELTGRECTVKDAPAVNMTAEAILTVIEHFFGDDALPRPRLIAALDAAVCTRLPGAMYHFLDIGTEQVFEGGTLTLRKNQTWEDYLTIQKYFHADLRCVYAKQERVRDFIDDMTILPVTKRRKRKALVP
jgi:hypothetical protein